MRGLRISTSTICYNWAVWSRQAPIKLPVVAAHALPNPMPRCQVQWLVTDTRTDENLLPTQALVSADGLLSLIGSCDPTPVAL
jgi:hypothetical protein